MQAVRIYPVYPLCLPHERDLLRERASSSTGQLPDLAPPVSPLLLLVPVSTPHSGQGSKNVQCHHLSYLASGSTLLYALNGCAPALHSCTQPRPTLARLPTQRGNILWVCNALSFPNVLMRRGYAAIAVLYVRPQARQAVKQISTRGCHRNYCNFTIFGTIGR